MSYATEDLVARLKALADPARLRIVMLCAQGECSVSELTQILGLSQPRVSQHLKQLIDEDLLERFRDGHYVFYRVPSNGDQAVARRRLLALLPDDEPEFARDVEKLRKLRSEDEPAPLVPTSDERKLHKALVDLTVAAPLGDLLDIGCGQGRILKLLASRTHRAVGVDIDSDARRLARAELLLAGSPNCSLRHGDMYSLPFDNQEFDTIILDGVLDDAERPTDVITEALRLLKTGGRVLLLSATGERTAAQIKSDFADWAAQTGLRLAQPRSIPDKDPGWLLGVATA